MIVFTEAMARAAKQIRQGLTLRVLLKLPEHLNFTDFVHIRTADLAAELETSTGAISRALAQLLEIGVVEKEGKGPRTAWRLSSDWGWNGSVDQWHALRAGRLGKKKAPATRASDQSSKSHNAYSVASSINHSSENINQIHEGKAQQSRLTLLRAIHTEPAG